ncbi:MAG: hypothetical protein ACXWCG_11630 [Flavitalea sp.]
MKYFVLVYLAVSVTLSVQAQTKSNHLKINGGAEITTRLFARGYNTGWGLYVTDYIGIANQQNLSLSTGVAFWNARNSSFKVGISLTRIGFRQFVSNGFYFIGDAGIGVGLKSWSGTTRFAFGGGTGYLFRNKKSAGLDLSVRANRTFNRTWIGLAAGYEFKL